MVTTIDIFLQAICVSITIVLVSYILNLILGEEREKTVDQSAIADLWTEVFPSHHYQVIEAKGLDFSSDKGSHAFICIKQDLAKTRVEGELLFGSVGPERWVVRLDPQRELNLCGKLAFDPKSETFKPTESEGWVELFEAFPFLNYRRPSFLRSVLVGTTFVRLELTLLKDKPEVYALVDLLDELIQLLPPLYVSRYPNNSAKIITGKINYRERQIILEHLRSLHYSVYQNQLIPGTDFGVIRADRRGHSKLEVRSYRRNRLTNLFTLHYEARVRTPVSFVLKPLTGTLISHHDRALMTFSLENWIKRSNENYNEVMDFLRSTGLLFPLTKSFTSLFSLVVSGNRLSVNVEIRYNPYRLVWVIDWLEQLTQALDYADDLPEFETYRCLSCGKIIEFHGNTCPFCNSPAPRCIICWVDPEPGESVVRFACCLSYAHRRHAKIWLGLRNYCPYCKKKNPLLVPVKDLA